MSELSSVLARSAKSVSYTSVYRFKGLEAPAVVLTDIERLDDEQSQALLYVGMSRARLQLTLLLNRKLQTAYQSLVLSNLRNLMQSKR